MTDQPDDRRPAAAENPFQSPDQSDNMDPAAGDGDRIHRSSAAGEICTLLAVAGMLSMGRTGGGVLMWLSAALTMCAVPGFYFCAVSFYKKRNGFVALAMVLNLWFIFVITFTSLSAWTVYQASLRSAAP